MLREGRQPRPNGSVVGLVRCGGHWIVAHRDGLIEAPAPLDAQMPLIGLAGLADAAFSWDEHYLLATGWQPGQVSVLSLSGGETSARAWLGPTGWVGPIVRVEQRLVAVCQGGIQTYWGPRNEGEYFTAFGT